MLLGANRRTNCDEDGSAKPFCHCYDKRLPTPWSHLNACKCGEDYDVSEWRWQRPGMESPSWVVLSDDKKQVIFHPSYSSGTAAVKGDTPLQHNYHYYWEVKMLTDTYGTDIMVGLGTDKVNINNPQYTFESLLGSDGESYGLSYTGVVRHNDTAAQSPSGFCVGTIIGVRVDMWRGTLEFYVNRKPQGISFYNLRRHQELFPMICSTAAQSAMRLVYAASWRASLLVDAARTLAGSVARRAPRVLRLPPGLWHALSKHFWLTMPGEGCMMDEDEEDMAEVDTVRIVTSVAGGAGAGNRKRRYWQTVPRASSTAVALPAVGLPAVGLPAVGLPAARSAQHTAAA